MAESFDPIGRSREGPVTGGEDGTRVARCSARPTRWRVLAFSLALLAAWAALYLVGRAGGPLGSDQAAPLSGSLPSSSAPPAGPSSRPAEPVSVGTLPGQEAPDFFIPTADGQAFGLSSHRGQVVVLDFLAQGCESCAQEVSALTKAWEAFRAKGVTVLLVDLGGGPVRQAAAYYRSLGGGDFLYGSDQGFRVARAYKVLALGTTVIVDPRGIISFFDSGPPAADLLDREIRKALA